MREPEQVYDFMTLEQKPGGDVIEFASPTMRRGIPGRVQVHGYSDKPQGEPAPAPGVTSVALAPADSFSPLLKYALIGGLLYVLLKGN